MITPKQAHAMTGFHSRKRTPEFEAEMESVISELDARFSAPSYETNTFIAIKLIKNITEEVREEVVGAYKEAGWPKVTQEVSKEKGEIVAFFHFFKED
ncbi:MAG: hypothetical protein P4L59_14235 [Desulfosporosinus sp.]|nr:hypothetical protein [Desulfosporosinus sp.]